MRYMKYVLYAIDNLFTFIRIHTPRIWNIIDLLTLVWIDALRLFCAHGTAKGLEKCYRPNLPLVLYEYEACPFCRKVRETLTVLNIDHMVYPCPRETFSSYGLCLNSRFRPDVKKEGGIAMFPFLIDPNTNVKMYQSDDIVKYLWKTYGHEATATWNYKLAHTQLYLQISLALCILARPCLDMGVMRAPTRAPSKHLQLWGIESSCFTRRVKETLSMLELPYLNHVMPFGADQKRQEFLKEHSNEISDAMKKLGFVQVPYLRDPNTGRELFESQEIVKYLKEQYQTRGVPAHSWLEYASKQ